MKTDFLQFTAWVRKILGITSRGKLGFEAIVGLERRHEAAVVDRSGWTALPRTGRLRILGSKGGLLVKPVTVI
jgi:hypothetical protein